MVPKQAVREKIWRLMTESGVGRFPPPYGRIPNFVGAEDAAKRLSDTNVWRNIETIKVNPDSPQRPVRVRALRHGIKLIMPTPRLKEGFLLLDPKLIPKDSYEFASTIRGAFFFGKRVKVEELPTIDLVVVGSVAVNLFGERVGKGGGYSEIEWALVREEGKVGEDTPIVTTVHDIQFLEERFETTIHDLPVDWIITPTRTIKTNSLTEKPKRIYWEKLSRNKIEEIPILRERWAIRT